MDKITITLPNGKKETAVFSQNGALNFAVAINLIARGECGGPGFLVERIVEEEGNEAHKS